MNSLVAACLLLYCCCIAARQSDANKMLRVKRTTGIDLLSLFHAIQQQAHADDKRFFLSRRQFHRQVRLLKQAAAKPSPEASIQSAGKRRIFRIIRRRMHDEQDFFQFIFDLKRERYLASGTAFFYAIFRQQYPTGLQVKTLLEWYTALHRRYSRRRGVERAG